MNQQPYSRLLVEVVCFGLTSEWVGCIDDRFGIEPIQQVQRAVVGHQAVYGQLGAHRLCLAYSQDSRFSVLIQVP